MNKHLTSLLFASSLILGSFAFAAEPAPEPRFPAHLSKSEIQSVYNSPVIAGLIAQAKLKTMISSPQVGGSARPKIECAIDFERATTTNQAAAGLFRRVTVTINCTGSTIYAEGYLNDGNEVDYFRVFKVFIWG